MKAEKPKRKLTARPPAKHAGGRPKKAVDWELIDDLLKIAATGEEIAAVLKVDYDTIDRRCKKIKHIGFAEYIKKGMSDCKISLRRRQMSVALGFKEKESRKAYPPNVTMLIWLGKQYLNQKDKQEIDQQLKIQEQITGIEIILPHESEDET